MAKSPRDRPANMADVRAALGLADERTVAAATPVGRRSRFTGVAAATVMLATLAAAWWASVAPSAPDAEAALVPPERTRRLPPVENERTQASGEGSSETDPVSDTPRASAAVKTRGRVQTVNAGVVAVRGKHVEVVAKYVQLR